MIMGEKELTEYAEPAAEVELSSEQELCLPLPVEEALETTLEAELEPESEWRWPPPPGSCTNSDRFGSTAHLEALACR